MKKKNTSGETGLYTTSRADGEHPRRVTAREIWDPVAKRFRPATPGDVPQELYDLDYPDDGYSRDDRYQTQCLRILRKAQTGKGIAGLPHPIRAYSSVNGITGMSKLTDSAAAGTAPRECPQALAAVSRLRRKLVDRPELRSLLDSFDTDGSGRFDFAGVAAKHGVSLATAYRWKDSLAEMAADLFS